MRLHLTLPFPPSANRYWRTVRNHPVVSAEAKRYREDVRQLIEETGAMAQGFGKSRVAMRVTFHAPDARRRDLDNYIKQPLDAMTLAGVFDDDSQVDDLRITRGPVEAPGRVEVVIEPVDTSGR